MPQKGPAWTPEIRSQYQKAYRAANPSVYLKSQLKSAYGDLVTLEQYQDAWEWQEGLCAGCGKPETRKTPSGGVALMSADHCHATGKFRGLLCSRCNLALGYAQDDPEILRSLASYLERGGSD